MCFVCDSTLETATLCLQGKAAVKVFAIKKTTTIWVLNLFWNYCFAWVQFSALFEFWFIVQCTFSNSKKSCLCLLYLFLYCHILSQQSVPSFSFLSCPITAFFKKFFYQSLYSLPSSGSIRVSVHLLFSLKLNIGLCVIQEEAAKSKTFSFQRLSPKWCFLDCEYSVISLVFCLNIYRASSSISHKCNHKHLWLILSDFSEDKTGIIISLHWRKDKNKWKNW